MSSGDDRREFSRVPFRIQATLAGDHETITAAEVRDVSLRGLYAVGAGRLPPGSTCTITLVLGGEDTTAQLRIRARVIRVDTCGLALEFLDMGLDTFVHLRNIILYNGIDRLRIEEEFREHLGLMKRE